MVEHAFPPTGFAVAWLGCSLHLVAAVGWLSMLFHDGVCCGSARLFVTLSS